MKKTKNKKPCNEQRDEKVECLQHPRTSFTTTSSHYPLQVNYYRNFQQHSLLLPVLSFI